MENENVENGRMKSEKDGERERERELTVPPRPPRVILLKR
jgi:hypothetical protein